MTTTPTTPVIEYFVESYYVDAMDKLDPYAQINEDTNTFYYKNNVSDTYEDTDDYESLQQF